MNEGFYFRTRQPVNMYSRVSTSKRPFQIVIANEFKDWRPYSVFKVRSLKVKSFAIG
jgi:hypothetical protein